MEKCNILLIDEQPLLMEGVRSILSPHPDIRIVGMAHNLEMLKEIVKNQRPDMIVMDTCLHELQGVEAVRVVRDICASAKVLIYTMYTDQRYLSELIQLGICAHVTKVEKVEILLEALQKVRKGHVFLSGPDHGGFFVKRMQQGLQNPPEHNIDRLSSREKEVFLRLADGQSIRHMAEALHISPKTVESHKYNIFTKLHIHSVSEITKIAIRLGLVHI